jgi:hypothetical protein
MNHMVPLYNFGCGHIESSTAASNYTPAKQIPVHLLLVPLDNNYEYLMEETKKSRRATYCICTGARSGLG